jgi:hypothetical protein
MGGTLLVKTCNEFLQKCNCFYNKSKCSDWIGFGIIVLLDPTNLDETTLLVNHLPPLSCCLADNS